MGRKGYPGLSLLLVTLVLVWGSSACRNRAPGVDPGEHFTPSGEEVVRELGIYAGRERVGDLSFGRWKGQWKGEAEAVQLSETVNLRLSFRSDRFAVTSSHRSWVDEKMVLLASSGSIDFGAGRWETTVQRGGDGLYEREQVSGRSRTRDRLDVPEGVITSDVLPLYLGKLRIREGERLELGVFNMTLGQQLPMSLEYKGESEAGRIYAVSHWGMEEKIWVDAAGMVVREEMMLGVDARVPEGGEQAGYLPLETVLAQTSVPALDVPRDLGDRDEAVILLQGSFRAPPDGKWQRIVNRDGETLVVLGRPVVPSGTLRQPDPHKMPGDTFGLDLDSPRIRELASDIAGSMEDPWDKTLAIGGWVYRELGKSMRECLSALQVLETGEGECQSHSLLTVSLLRAAGLPARFAYGLVYLPDRGAYGYHTWVQVHIGQWIPIDPTLGNFPAGVDHLTLAVGGYQDQFHLFPYIMGQGGWSIKYIEQGERPGA